MTDEQLLAHLKNIDEYTGPGRALRLKAVTLLAAQRIRELKDQLWDVSQELQMAHRDEGV